MRISHYSSSLDQYSLLVIYDENKHGEIKSIVQLFDTEGRLLHGNLCNKPYKT